MYYRIPLALACLVGVLAFSNGAQTPAVAVGSEAIKSVSLFNLPDAAAESEFVAVLSEMNSAALSAGSTTAPYRFWKVTGEQQGNHLYMWEGSWPSQAEYDRIHQHPAYVEMMQKVRPRVVERMGSVTYNRYVERK